MEITGKIAQITDIETGISRTTGTAWQQRHIILEVSGSRPKQIAFELRGNTVETYKDLSVGRAATVSFDLESREFAGKWYTTARAWKIV